MKALPVEPSNVPVAIGSRIRAARQSQRLTIEQVADATGWQPHTVRGFFAGLKKRGIEVSVLDRVRQVGPNNAGAKGSYTVYRIAEAG